jgi:hypothetical protein
VARGGRDNMAGASDAFPASRGGEGGGEGVGEIRGSESPKGTLLSN